MGITSYLNQTATLKPRSGVDRYGKPTIGTTSTFRCRAQGSKTRVFNDQGVETQADLEMWVEPSLGVSEGDKIEFESKNYSVAKLDTKRKLTGVANHKKLLLLESKE